MNVRRLSALMSAAFALAACSNAGGSYENAALESDDQKASYAIGLDIGRNLLQVESHLDRAAFEAGVDDALAEREQRIPDEELQEVMAAFSQTIQEEAQAEMDAEATANAEAGQAYLEENGAREGVVTTESGLQYEVIEEGSGERPGPEDQATIHYRGTLIDGTEFDSSYARNEPATFPLSGVIAGFSEGLQLMPVGSHYRFVIPSELAYGLAGSPPAIGPNSTLVFEVELLEIP